MWKNEFMENHRDNMLSLQPLVRDDFDEVLRRDRVEERDHERKVEFFSKLLLLQNEELGVQQLL